jgi:hypothetical protein
MKNILKLTLVVIPFSFSMSISAQPYPDADMEGQPEMNQMMAVMQKMQNCILKINKKDRQMVEKKSRTFSAEIQSLCAKGKRAEAEKKSQQFGKKMMNDPVIKEINKCSKMMTSMIPESAVEDIHACEATQDVGMYNQPKF